MGILMNNIQNLSDIIWTIPDELKIKVRRTKGLQSFSDKPEPDLFNQCYVQFL